MASKEVEHALAIKIKDIYNFMDIVISDEIPYTLYCANDFKKVLIVKIFDSLFIHVSLLIHK